MVAMGDTAVVGMGVGAGNIAAPAYPKRLAFFLWQMGQLVVLALCFWLMERMVGFSASQREGRIWLSLLLVMPFLEHNFLTGGTLL